MMPPTASRHVSVFADRLLRSLLFFGLLLTVGCGHFSDTGTADNLAHERSGFSPEYLALDDTVEPDADMQAFLLKYTEALNREMNRRIAVSRTVIESGQPESALGNLTADITREHASRYLGREVDIALLNRGGLRTPIPEGDVTVGMIYELMPFENYITLLKFSGDQIRAIANELAIEGGEPVSGLQLRIDGDRATDILVGGVPLRSDHYYWLATNNWMADGGGPVPTLWEPVERRDTGILLRDAFIESIESQRQLSPTTEGRIRR
ncbi:MAG: hypothetical protein EA353_10595 [Puniceicoccaceae bacterium]|nr:MAG: hypothetical protein EA353_10595 [Puniceicoccaceae bacterium]